jgi:hypothetical protein
MKRSFLRVGLLLLVLAIALTPLSVSAAGSFLGRLNTVTTVASTVPANGDQNPYGVAMVPRTVGNLVEGNILVSNFNNAGNAQGTGSTIVQIAPDGTTKLFAQIQAGDLRKSCPCPGGVGLTTALTVLSKGWVIVGSLPTSDGSAATAQAGCLIVLDSHGRVVETLSGDGINGPWDMTALDLGSAAVLFVTNVLNGTVASSPNVVNKGTVLRIELVLPGEGKPREVGRKVIASGFGERTDPDALVIGPTGLGLGCDGTLYVADTLAGRIAAIPNAVLRRSDAGTGRTVSQGGAINGPLGLAIAPNGNIIVANGGDGNLVEVSPAGAQVATKTVTDSGAGNLFGLAIAPHSAGVYFVDDGTNQLNLLHR